MTAHAERTATQGPAVLVLPATTLALVLCVLGSRAGPAPLALPVALLVALPLVLGVPGAVLLAALGADLTGRAAEIVVCSLAYWTVVGVALVTGTGATGSGVLAAVVAGSLGPLAWPARGTLAAAWAARDTGARWLRAQLPGPRWAVAGGAGVAATLLAVGALPAGADGTTRVSLALGPATYGQLAGGMLDPAAARRGVALEVGNDGDQPVEATLVAGRGDGTARETWPVRLAAGTRTPLVVPLAAAGDCPARWALQLRDRAGTALTTGLVVYTAGPPDRRTGCAR